MSKRLISPNVLKVGRRSPKGSAIVFEVSSSSLTAYLSL
jgi:hypothetical protein